MNKLILYIATSLDGYIADENSKVNFLDEIPMNEEVSKIYNDFYEQIGTIIMGNSTYKQIISELSPDKWVYPNKKSYVYSKINKGSNDKIEYTNKNPKALIDYINNESSSDIWLVGGSKTIKEFQNANLIDEYIITVFPTILGNGIPLFQNGTDKKQLELSSVKKIDQIIELRYIKKIIE